MCSSIAGKMASSQYGVTLKQLRDLMEVRGKEAVDKLQEVGGSQGLCKKLKTSEANGKEGIRKERERERETDRQKEREREGLGRV